MEKSRAKEFIRSLSKEDKLKLVDLFSRCLEGMDLDIPEPLYACFLSYGHGKSRWCGYVTSAVLDGDSIVIHTSSDPCVIDESLCDLAISLFQFVCEGVYSRFETRKCLIGEVQHDD